MQAKAPGLPQLSCVRAGRRRLARDCHMVPARGDARRAVHGARARRAAVPVRRVGAPILRVRPGVRPAAGGAGPAHTIRALRLNACPLQRLLQCMHRQTLKVLLPCSVRACASSACSARICNGGGGITCARGFIMPLPCKWRAVHGAGAPCSLASCRGRQAQSACHERARRRPASSRRSPSMTGPRRRCRPGGTPTGSACGTPGRSS